MERTNRCAVFVSYSRHDEGLVKPLVDFLGIAADEIIFTTQYKKTPEEVGDLWYFLAALAGKLARESQDAFYRDLGRLATEIIQ